jgi:hypothetical protein
MSALVTLDVAKEHLRVDHADDDPDIDRKIGQATAIVTRYIERSAGDDDVEWDETTVPADVQAAILLMVQWLYDNRDAGVADDQVALGYPPRAVTSILHRWRVPAFA